jgi:PAS domain S-box-containing protein
MDLIVFDLSLRLATDWLREVFSQFPVSLHSASFQPHAPLELRPSVSGIFLLVDVLAPNALDLLAKLRNLDEEIPIIIVQLAPNHAQNQPEKPPDWAATEITSVDDFSSPWTTRFIVRLFEDYEFEITRRPLIKAIESTGESVVLTDTNGIITYVNPAFTEVTGYTPSEAIGQTPRLWKSQLHPPEFYIEMWRVILAGNRWSGELINCRKNGENYHSHLSISPVKIRGNQILGFVAMHTDISQFKNTEKELVNVRAQTLAAAKIQMQFLANMNHELRTPLNAINGSIELIQKTKLTTLQKDHLQTLASASTRLLRTISDLIDLSAVAESRLNIVHTDYSPHIEIEKLLTMLRPLAARKNLHLSLNIAANVPTKLSGDPARICQIISNFVSNSIKFSAVGNIEITIKIHQLMASSKLVIEVTDRGDGVKKSYRRKLFTRFSKLSEDQPIVNGSGLGLAISKDLAELMGGKVGYKVGKPSGSVFWFSIPIQKEATEATKKNRSNLPHLTYNILIVEDDELSGKVLKGLIDNLGYRCSLEADGPKALKLALNGTFHLILLDCMMPIMNGFEFTQQLRKRGGQIPIIGMSANVSMQNQTQCRVTGMSDFIEKPIDFLKLKRCLQTWLHGKSLKQSKPGQVKVAHFKTDFKKRVSEQLELLTSATSKQATSEIINLFLRNTPLKLNNLGNAISQLNFDSIQQISHQLKSSCGYLGLESLQAALERLEHDAIKRDSAHFLELNAELVQQFPRYSEILSSYAEP